MTMKARSVTFPEGRYFRTGIRFLLIYAFVDTALIAGNLHWASDTFQDLRYLINFWEPEILNRLYDCPITNGILMGLAEWLILDVCFDMDFALSLLEIAATWLFGGPLYFFIGIAAEFLRQTRRTAKASWVKRVVTVVFVVALSVPFLLILRIILREA